jgi:hypothetical protein
LTTLLNRRILISNVIEQLNITVISLKVQHNNSGVLRDLSFVEELRQWLQVHEQRPPVVWGRGEKGDGGEGDGVINGRIGRFRYALSCSRCMVVDQQLSE